ncbi:Spore coat protein CotO [Lentibacillus persicus]|uniref:Spore coat protein CotO n=1 Tax=Lentibacillus persicus TaxID=640948 RepID=A0A1I1RXV9_9BACI|nr:CotO family spore coat protein [Lentibacillus persicus]SFD39194.1 Spore coat protein CotO [Lentibacillus persicus]
MGNRKQAKSPLLYIQQPQIKTPEASMQSHYMTSKKQRDTKVQNSIKRPGSRQKFTKLKDDDQEETFELSGENEKEQSEDHRPREKKKFKDMTLDERVEYFLDTPDHAPIMKCEVKTEGRNYRGIIVDYQDDNVYMRVGRRTTPTSIPFETIKEINLIGF